MLFLDPVPQGSVTSLRFSPDAAFLLVGFETGVQLRDGSGGSLVWERRAEGILPGPEPFSPCGERFATGGKEIVVRSTRQPGDIVADTRSSKPFCFLTKDEIIQAKSGNLIRWKFLDGSSKPLRIDFVDNGYSSQPVECHAFDRIHQRMATVRKTERPALFKGNPHSVVLVDYSTGKPQLEFPAGHRRHSRPTKLRFSPDGSCLAALCQTETMVWRLGEYAENIQLNSTPNRVLKDCRFTPDGSHLLAVGNDGYVFVWNVETGSEVRRMDWQMGSVSAMDIAPDGFRVAVGGEKGQIIVWDVDFQ